MNWKKLGDGFEYANPIQYNQEYRQVEIGKEAQENDKGNENSQCDEENKFVNKGKSLKVKLLWYSYLNK